MSLNGIKRSHSGHCLDNGFLFLVINRPAKKEIQRLNNQAATIVYIFTGMCIAPYLNNYGEPTRKASTVAVVVAVAVIRIYMAVAVKLKLAVDPAEIEVIALELML
jgi:hypothetical protein